MAEWVQMRPRNEALDCLLLALVALRRSGLDLKHAKVGAGGTAIPETAPAAPTTPTIPAALLRPKRRNGFVSNY
jgi:phage terminase large subunit GpA-like protein